MFLVIPENSTITDSGFMETTVAAEENDGSTQDNEETTSEIYSFYGVSTHIYVYIRGNTSIYFVL